MFYRGFDVNDIIITIVIDFLITIPIFFMIAIFSLVPFDAGGGGWIGVSSGLPRNIFVRSSWNHLRTKSDHVSFAFKYIPQTFTVDILNISEIVSGEN